MKNYYETNDLFKTPTDKYFMIITCEDDDHNLLYYSEHPENGTLIGVEWFSTLKELERIITLHEGMLYQLFNNENKDLISYGVVDAGLPEDLEYYGDENFSD